MSFFDYVLNGLGLTKVEVPPKVRTKEKKVEAKFIEPSKTKVAPITQKTESVAIFSPSKISDLPEIVDFLSTKQQALLDLNVLDERIMQRVVDFVGGAVMALGGKVENLGGNLFLLAPKNTKILRKQKVEK